MKNAFILTFLLLIFSLQPQFSSADAASPALPIEEIKKELLKDGDFVKQISKQLDKSAIENIIRSYFIKNPEFLLYVTQLVVKKQNQELEQKRANILAQGDNKLLNPKQDLIIGSEKSLHNIYEFVDFNCGTCREELANNEKLVAKHPEVRVIIKELPILGDDSIDTHIISRAIHEIAPEKQKIFIYKIATSGKRSTKNSAIETALSIGVDKNKLIEYINNPTKRQQLENYISETAQLASELSINCTPTFIVDGKIYEGKQDFDEILKTIK